MKGKIKKVLAGIGAGLGWVLFLVWVVLPGPTWIFLLVVAAALAAMIAFERVWQRPDRLSTWEILQFVGIVLIVAYAMRFQEKNMPPQTGAEGETK